ncbi:MAG: TetR/AcrR family transcriptional regulator [Oscillospiraceae bacterium]|nr:TetR/AcrR family transcriptional regulator [Oscillospiraceae bacterium]
MREKIISAALEVFDSNGFFKAGIRDIAKLANCSLPTLYYYFKNKEDLFETSVCVAYESLTAQIDEQLPEGMPLYDRYYFAVMQRQMLTPDEKRVFRIAMKIQLGVDGFESANKRLSLWEENRRRSEREAVGKINDDPAFAALVMRVVDDMLMRSILFGEALPPEQIKRELAYLFN